MCCAKTHLCFKLHFLLCDVDGDGDDDNDDDNDGEDNYEEGCNTMTSKCNDMFHDKVATD